MIIIKDIDESLTELDQCHQLRALYTIERLLLVAFDSYKQDSFEKKQLFVLGRHCRERIANIQKTINESIY